MTVLTSSPLDTEGAIERLQTWMRGVDAIVLGSGASADYGYPLMAALADHLLRVIIATADEQPQWSNIAAKLASGVDLETSLTDVALPPRLLSEIVSETWKLVSGRDLELYDRIVEGVPDFPLAKLISWLDTARKRIDIITTNYDRTVEYACDSAGVVWVDGTGFGHLRRHMRGFGTTLRDNPNGSVSTIARIWKVHGSLDWFCHGESDAFLATSLSAAIPREYVPLIVTPGLAKYQRALADPFRSILTGSDDVVRNSSIFLCLGYGFNDRHVHEKLIAKSHDSHSKFIVLARKLTENTKKFLVHGGCKNYMAIERGYDDAQSLVWSQGFIDPVTLNQNAWSMAGLCSIVL